MKKSLIFISNQHDLIFKTLLIGFCIAVIAAILPRDKIQRFDFQKGRTWTGDDLYAPFDFSIQKDQDSLNRERNNAVAEVLPHFTFDGSVGDGIYRDLQVRLSRSRAYDSLHSGYTYTVKLNSGAEIINRIYDSGVMESETKKEFAPQQNRVVLVNGRKASSVDISTILTLKNARKIAYELAAGTGDTLLGNILSGLVKSNVFYDQNLTALVRANALNEVSPSSGLVRKGDLIISKGNVIDNSKARVLRSLFIASGNNTRSTSSKLPVLIGQLLIIICSLAMLIIFLAFLRKDIFKDNRKITLLFILIILNIGMFVTSLHITDISQYVVPLCILPIIIRVFFDTRLALFTHIISILILGAVAYNGYEFIFMQSVAGMVTVFSVTNLRRRAQLFISSGLILVSYLITYIGLEFIHEGSLYDINWMNFIWLLGNVMLTLFAYPLIYLFEKVFDLVSDVSLMELSDVNTPLLRELSLKAPGTFQHSMQVANLAEAAIFRIGGNTLLVRVGALYHDIGKMDMPMYFIENQNTGVNSHDDLSFEESAGIIISHVIIGIEKGRKNKLPDIVIDFIRTHHGTTMVQYFYQSFLKNYPEKMAQEDKFRYPGPLPFSKETAVLMMADSVEAASRSLPNPDAAAINNLVDNIIKNQIVQEQFVNSDITFRDITRIKKIFKKMLMSVYHVRVEYPE
jgi:cyclic-di-AMP phosphodiesterase PgpH